MRRWSLWEARRSQPSWRRLWKHKRFPFSYTPAWGHSKKLPSMKLSPDWLLPWSWTFGCRTGGFILWSDPEMISVSFNPGQQSLRGEWALVGAHRESLLKSYLISWNFLFFFEFTSPGKTACLVSVTNYSLVVITQVSVDMEIGSFCL